MSQNDNQQTSATSSTDVEPRLKRNGSISYLFLPAINVYESAAFYEKIFGWKISGGSADHLSFDDASGYISGAWVTHQAISHEPGLLPYIYVDHIEEIVEQIKAQKGEIIKAPYPEGNLQVATFRDPAGNLIGLWQEEDR